MQITTKHLTKKWEVSILEYKSENGNTLFKVTRRLPDVSTAETKVFNSKEEALKQFNEWLN